MNISSYPLSDIICRQFQSLRLNYLDIPASARNSLLQHSATYIDTVELICDNSSIQSLFPLFVQKLPWLFSTASAYNQLCAHQSRSGYLQISTSTLFRYISLSALWSCPRKPCLSVMNTQQPDKPCNQRKSLCFITKRLVKLRLDTTFVAKIRYPAYSLSVSRVSAFLP